MEFDKLPREYQQEVINYLNRDKSADDSKKDKKEEKFKKMTTEQLLAKKKEIQEMVELMEFEVDYLGKKKDYFHEVMKKKEKEDSGKESGSETD